MTSRQREDSIFAGVKTDRKGGGDCVLAFMLLALGHDVTVIADKGSVI